MRDTEAGNLVRLGLLWLLLVSGLWASAGSSASTTDWALRPSLKYDALCLLEVLSGDPYYLTYYQADYDRFAPQFTKEERADFVELKRLIKDENGGAVSPMLLLYLSAAAGDSMAETIAAVHDSSELKRNFQQTTYYDEKEWQLYERARPALERALRALDRIHFEAYWGKEIRPQVEKAIPAFAADLPKYNIAPVIAGMLGHPLASNRITVYLLYYSQPYGIKITGTRFITHYSYPFGIVLHNAIHEMMHPPYDAGHDAGIKSGLAKLGKEKFLMDKVEHHNPAFGYNTLEGFVEEDCVQFLEAVVADKVGAGRDQQEYWRAQDDGMHVLAAALYQLAKQEKFTQSGEDFPHFFARMLGSGKLTGGGIEKLNQVFFAVGKGERSRADDEEKSPARVVRRCRAHAAHAASLTSTRGLSRSTPSPISSARNREYCTKMNMASGPVLGRTPPVNSRTDMPSRMLRHTPSFGI
jgi:hypothetical protein